MHVVPARADRVVDPRSAERTVVSEGVVWDCDLHGDGFHSRVFEMRRWGSASGRYPTVFLSAGFSLCLDCGMMRSMKLGQPGSEMRFP